MNYEPITDETIAEIGADIEAYFDNVTIKDGASCKPLNPWDKCANRLCQKPGKFLGSFCSECHHKDFDGRYLSADHLLTEHKASLGG